MNLEDHLGDIIKKGRRAANVSEAAAAKAAGITEAELATLEQSGQTPAKPNLAALAALLGLHPGKLQGIANGWLPSEKDLSVWCELRCFSTEEDGTAVAMSPFLAALAIEAGIFLLRRHQSNLLVVKD